MRALQIPKLDGPDALEATERPEPEPSHPVSPGRGVVVEVRAIGVSFPDLLQTRGLYQIKPDLPYVPGGEIAGVVTEASGDAGFAPGDRVAAMTLTGGMAERAVAPPLLTFRLPDALDDAQGAALIMNYHTALFALKTRAALREGETVLVHGAAGGVGTATLQVAGALGARTIAVVSSDAKEAVAREAGADEVVWTDGEWKDAARELSGGGVDVVVAPVGGGRFTDSLRSLREGGRVVVVGFTAGSIPEVRVNRLLLNNVSGVGAGWGAFVMGKPNINAEIGEEINRLVGEGFVRPLVGARFPLEDAAKALAVIDERRATGKVVLDVREPA